MYVGMGGAGDSVVDFYASSSHAWTMGMDYTDGWAFKISTSTDFSSNVLSISTSTGLITVSDITCTDCIDISGETNLTVGATGIELSADDIALTANYVIPLTASTTEWATAYGWGDWSGEGFIDNTVTTLSSLTSIGTIGTGVWEGTAIAAGYYAAGSIDGDDINANLAGRSLTLTGASPDTLDADAELFTKMVTFSVKNSTTTDNPAAQHKFATAITITRISCSTATGTVSIQLDERAEATPNTAGTDVMNLVLVCDTNTEATTTFANAAIAADVPLSLDIDAVSVEDADVRIHIDYTKDD